ncbi:MAG: hypothetical protein JWP74_517 [Marmoricola sp.]|nr:hypothetical protein [Marmoricola sp.]
MSDVVPYSGGGGLARRDSKRLERSISAGRASTELRISRAFNDEQVALAKLDVASAACGAAAGHVARVARLVQSLQLECPDATNELNAIKSAHAHFLISELSSLERALRYR